MLQSRLRQPLQAARKSSSGSDKQSTVVVNNHATALDGRETALPEGTDRGQYDRHVNALASNVYDDDDAQVFVLGGDTLSTNNCSSVNLANRRQGTIVMENVSQTKNEHKTRSRALPHPKSLSRSRSVTGNGSQSSSPAEHNRQSTMSSPPDMTTVGSVVPSAGRSISSSLFSKLLDLSTRHRRPDNCNGTKSPTDINSTSGMSTTTLKSPSRSKLPVLPVVAANSQVDKTSSIAAQLSDSPGNDQEKTLERNRKSIASPGRSTSAGLRRPGVTSPDGSNSVDGLRKYQQSTSSVNAAESTSGGRVQSPGPAAVSITPPTPPSDEATTPWGKANGNCCASDPPGGGPKSGGGRLTDVTTTSHSRLTSAGSGSKSNAVHDRGSGTSKTMASPVSRQMISKETTTTGTVSSIERASSPSRGITVGGPMVRPSGKMAGTVKEPSRVLTTRHSASKDNSHDVTSPDRRVVTSQDLVKLSRDLTASIRPSKDFTSIMTSADGNQLVSTSSVERGTTSRVENAPDHVTGGKLNSRFVGDVTCENRLSPASSGSNVMQNASSYVTSARFHVMDGENETESHATSGLLTRERDRKQTASSCPPSPVIVGPQRSVTFNEFTSRNATGCRSTGFVRASPGRLSAGTRRLPVRPDVTPSPLQVSPHVITPTVGSPRIGSERRQAVVVQNDPQPCFERGISTRSSLPIVRSSSATSGLHSAAGINQKPASLNRVASCRQPQRNPPADVGIESRLSSAYDITDKEMAAMSTASRSLHPVGRVGSSSPASGRGTPRKLLPISTGSGKKPSSKTAGNADFKLKGERLSNYNKVSDVVTSSTSTPLSTPPPHRVHPVAPQSPLHNGSTSPLVDGRRRALVEPLPAVSPDNTVCSPYIGDATGNGCGSSPLSSSSSSAFDYRRDVDDIRGSSVALRRDLEEQFVGSHAGTVVLSNQSAVHASTPPTSRVPGSKDSRLSRPLTDSRQGRLMIDTPIGMTSSSLTDIVSPSPSVQFANRRRPVAASSHRQMVSGTETDVEELTSGRRESSAAARKFGGFDWFSEARSATGTLPHKNTTTACEVVDSSFASPTSGLHKPSAGRIAAVVTSSTLSSMSGSLSMSAPHHQLACRTVSTPIDSNTLTNRLAAMVTSPTSKGGTLTRYGQQSDALFRSRMNSTVEENVTGSQLSLGSNSSSTKSTAEELQAQEIRKLRQELMAAHSKIASLSCHLNTNAHVVTAFEQSLTSMTQRLQRLAATTDRKDAELNELRTTIELLRQHGYKFNRASADLSLFNTSSAPDHSLCLGRQVSFDSIESDSSAISQHSNATTTADSIADVRMRKSKSWFSAFGKALRRKKKTNASINDVHQSDISGLYADVALTMSVPTQLCQASLTSASPLVKSATSDATLVSASTGDSLGDDAVALLQRQLREKDSRLTDVQLEALTSAHRLQQMRDMMMKMKKASRLRIAELTDVLSEAPASEIHGFGWTYFRPVSLVASIHSLTISTPESEIASLRCDNERLHHVIAHKGIGSSAISGSEQDLQKSPLQCPGLGDPSSNLDFLLVGGASSRDTRSIKLYVQLNKALSDEQEAANKRLVLIGQLSVDTKTNWDSLDDVIRKQFKEHLLRIDPETSLGLSDESITRYSVGEVMRCKDLDRPELLPCGYLVGDTNSITLSLKGVENQSVDSLAFEMLTPKSIVERYVSLLLEHCRIILSGSSGTGKTYLAQKLAEHIVLRSGKKPDSNAIVTFSIDSQSSRELRKYLSNIAEQYNQGAAQLPSVIILDSLHHVTVPLADIFSGLLGVEFQTSPYIIGTMNQTSTCSSTNLQLHHNFRWVLIANHMEPVFGFLGRYLRRKQSTAEALSAVGSTENDVNRIVEWIPRLWRHLNRLIETHNSAEMTIGPRLFLSCPMDSSLVPVWFTDLWNYSIVPYVLEVIREGMQTYGVRASWEDPTDWVLSTCPWKNSELSDLSSLMRIRPKDVGLDGAAAATSSSVSVAVAASGTPMSNHRSVVDAPADPLMNMLMRLQEAADYTGGCQQESIVMDSQPIDAISS